MTTPPTDSGSRALSSPSSAAPSPLNQDVIWHISPAPHLRIRNCPCITAQPTESTASAELVHQLRRLEKLWKRLTGSAKVPSKVKDAATRLLLTLRGVGLEEFHWIARQRPLSAGDKRKEFSIILLTPSPDAPTGHRAVAEMSVQECIRGRRKGQIDNIATRQAENWKDWSSTVEYTYLEVPDAPLIRFQIPSKGNVKAAHVVEAVWAEVAGILGGDDPSSKTSFLGMVSRVTLELDAEGSLVNRFEITTRVRESKGRKSVVSSVLVSVYTTPASPRPHCRERIDLDPAEPEDGVGEEAADVVIMIDPQGTQGKTKSMAVSYHESWPLVHFYRMRFPPPKDEDWAGLVKSKSTSGSRRTSKRSSVAGSSSSVSSIDQ